MNDTNLEVLTSRPASPSRVLTRFSAAPDLSYSSLLGNLRNLSAPKEIAESVLLALAETPVEFVECRIEDGAGCETISSAAAKDHATLSNRCEHRVVAAINQVLMFRRTHVDFGGMGASRECTHLCNSQQSLLVFPLLDGESATFGVLIFWGLADGSKGREQLLTRLSAVALAVSSRFRAWGYESRLFSSYSDMKEAQPARSVLRPEIQPIAQQLQAFGLAVALQETNNIHDLCSAVLLHMQQILPVEQALILIGNARDGLLPVVSEGLLDDQGSDGRKGGFLPCYGGRLWQAIEWVEPVFVKASEHLLDIEAPLLLHSERNGGSISAALAYLPLRISESQVGLIALRCTGDLTVWELERSTCLLSISQLLSLSLARASRFAELEQDKKWSQALADVLELTGRDRVPEDVARELVNIIAPVADVDWGSISEVTDDVMYLHPVWGEQSISAEFRQLISHGTPRGLGVAWKVLENREPVYIDDFAAAEGAHPKFVELGLRSVALIPLVTDPNESPMIFGAVRMHRSRPWTQKDRNLFREAARSVQISYERRRHVKQLERAAMTDALTSLGNRRAFDLDLTAAVNAAVTNRHSVTILCMDLDGLKVVNDRDGHPNGDLLLRTFASALRSSFRSEDRVYRIGGDEFSILLSHSGVDSQRSVMDRVRLAVKKVQSQGFSEADISSGMASFPEEADSIAELYRLSDQRMYSVKTLHRHRAQRSNPAIFQLG